MGLTTLTILTKPVYPKKQDTGLWTETHRVVESTTQSSA